MRKVIYRDYRSIAGENDTAVKRISSIDKVAQYWARELLQKWLRTLKAHYRHGQMRKRLRYVKLLVGPATFYGIEMTLGRRVRYYGVYISEDPYIPEANTDYAPWGSPQSRHFFFTRGFFDEAWRVKSYIKRHMLACVNDPDQIYVEEVWACEGLGIMRKMAEDIITKAGDSFLFDYYYINGKK